MENAYSKYVVYAPNNYEIKKDWFQKIMNSIKNLEKAILSTNNVFERLIFIQKNANIENEDSTSFWAMYFDKYCQIVVKMENAFKKKVL